ncbi:MAG: GTP 3',8-cyclase MoaA [Acidilobaceae archaeon]|nr:GTP 3',8-cyclase MoaA [Acidilobaceae archaeon]
MGEGLVLRDAYGRPLRSMRLLVTKECNYRCFFCHLEGDPLGGPALVGSRPPALRPEDYEVIAEAAHRLGVRSFKITGGEPLIRRDITEVVKAVSSSAPGADVSMTTNGLLLERYANELAEAGLRRVNVSIHSLRRERYKFITGVDGLERAIKGLEAAVRVGIRAKINALILAGVNEDEVFELIEFSRKVGAVLQLIELIPVGLGAKLLRTHRFSLSKLEEKLIEMGAKAEVRELHNRPVYLLPNGGAVELVKPSSALFCAGCDRLRLDADGKLSPCINWRGERVDLLSRIRGKQREEAVEEAMRGILEANWLRRPFYLPKIGEDSFPRGELRAFLPKKASDLRALEALLAQRARSVGR